jgi:ankyrin repeat protein
VNAASYDGSTPFHLCSEFEEFGLFKLLVLRGADPTANMNVGNALHAAARYGNTSVCRYLVEDCALDINAEFVECQDSSIENRTPLSLAAQNGNIEVCRYLLDKGAILDAGYQPLIAAAWV